MSITTTVDHYADRITKIADEMKAAGISTEHNSGAVAILRDIASDLRCQVRHRQSIPNRVNFDSIQAFGGRKIQASAGAQRTDLPSKLEKLFASASMPLPAVGSIMTAGEVDAMLREAGCTDTAERMEAKTLLEKAGIVTYGTTNVLFGSR